MTAPIKQYPALSVQKKPRLNLLDNEKPTLDGDPARPVGWIKHPYDGKWYFVVERIRDFALIGLR